MGGGLMQLVAYGAQDVYLSGNPQITFFKVVYRRHTNFSVEPIPQTWNGVGDFGRTVTCNINRNGDLITNMYLVVELTDTTVSAPFSVPWGYVRRLGNALVQSAKIEIGGSQIDMQYGDWLNVWYELTHKTGQERGFARMIGDTAELKTVDVNGKTAQTLYVPLQFWFNRNNGLALPLIALQYHDVRVTVVLNNRASCVNFAGTTAPSFNNGQGMDDCYLLIDYVYLDSEERKRFAQASHEYLIEQLQFTGSESLTSTNNKYRLNFNHPCKYVVWAPHFQRYANQNQWLSYAEDGNWGAAKDRFAKLLVVLCNNGLAVTSSSVSVRTVSTTEAGEVLDLSGLSQRALNLGAAVTALLDKVDVKAVVQSVTASSGDTPVYTAVLATGTSTFNLVHNLLQNLMVPTNHLSMEDVSNDVVDVQALLGSVNTTHAAALVGHASLTIVDYFNYGNMVDGSDNPCYNGKLQLNGHDRFQDRDGNYFNYVQPFQHFTNTPADGVNVYSFALKPEDHQPTGSCNFSRIDNATLLVDIGKNNRAYSTADNAMGGFAKRDGLLSNGASSLINIYTVNYNVLRVMSGMAGTAYSN
jgi:hypothetical protein